MNNSGQSTTLQKLHEKYAHLFNGTNLIIPDRLRLEKLENDKFYNDTLALYSTDPLKMIEDQEILDLIEFHDNKLGYAIRIFKDPYYHNLPEYHKFPIYFFLDPNCTLYYHAKISNTSANEFIFSKGLILNNHKYPAYPFDEKFRYPLYYEYLKEKYNIDEEHSPRCHPGTSADDKEFFINDEPLMHKQVNWASLGVNQLWKLFKQVECLCTRTTLERCHSVALDIEKGIVNCLTFGQFAQVLPLLPHLKKRALDGLVFTPKAPKKLSNSIFVRRFVCGSNFSDSQMTRVRNNKRIKQNVRKRLSAISAECDVTYLITIDMKHRVIIIEQEGNHSAECRTYQRQKGYLIIRRLITEYTINVMNSRFNIETLKYYGGDEIIKKPYFFKDENSSFIRQDTGMDYNLDIALLFDFLEKKTGQFSYQDKYLKFDLNENIIAEKIHYGDVDGLVIGSTYSLDALSQQVMFGMDATFNVTKYKDLKLLTVVFLNNSGNIVLGCVGLLLSGAESAGNISAFLNAMKRAILKVNP